ncbi:hypothetical protein ASD81_08330 [Nocardioides sp. Root614]|nr:hypothetical protein ASD81_08330 [Nocardioides sp. Root614]KRA92565.1 hypothetical protein ASD84_08595 [Nocardioides sp. Root682]
MNKRASYAKDARVIGAPRGGGGVATATAPPPTASRVEATREPFAKPTLPAGPDSTSAGRSVLAALGVEDSTPPVVEPATSVDTTAAGRSVVDALNGSAESPRREARARAKQDKQPKPDKQVEQAERTEKRKPAPRPSRGPTVRVTRPAPSAGSTTRDESGTTTPARAPSLVPTTATPQVRQSRWTEPEEHLNANHATTDADFPARGTARRVLSLVLLAALAATAATSYVAYQDRTVAALGIAGTLGFLTLVVWAVRAGSTTTKMSIRRGKLSIERGGHVDLIDVGSSYTPIAIIGEPGHRRWTVLIERRGMPLVVINSSMVDPHWFTSALYRLRPELRPGAAEDDDYADDDTYAGSV